MLHTTVTVGSGKAIHWGNDCGTLCGAAHRNGFFTEPKLTKASKVTCKRCIKIMVARVEADYAQAVQDDESRTIARAFLSTPSGTVLTADEITAACEAAEAQTEALVSSHARPASKPLDIWLEKGVVLVDPLTGDLMTFECWNSLGALLRNHRTGAQHVVGQSLITTWEYVPSAGVGPVDAGDVKVGDLVRFVHGGETFEVQEVEHHAGTDLYSFGVRHSLRQFVRHATEQVHRVAQ